MSEREKTQDHDGDHTEEPPGPTDKGRQGGMATREVAPELSEPED